MPLEEIIRCQEWYRFHKWRTVIALHGEMSSEFEFNDNTQGMKSRRKNSMPYWNNWLKLLWDQAREVEKDYLKYRCENTQRNTLRCHFLNFRTHLDKELRRAVRTYNASSRDNMQKLCTGDPIVSGMLLTWDLESIRTHMLIKSWWMMDCISGSGTQHEKL